MRVLVPSTSWRRLGALVIVGLILAGCGGANTSVLSNVGAPIGAEPQAAASAAPAEGDRSGSSAGEPSTGGGTGQANPPSALRDDLKIVYTGSLDLQVVDLEASLEKGRVAVAAVGGYVGGSQESNGDTPVATITYRIPAGRWTDALGALRALAQKVVSEETKASEVGTQLVDLEARIRNLRASETALQEIARSAGKISDLLEVQQQLTDVRGQIEELDAQRTQLNDQVAYGTLVTTFHLDAAPAKVAEVKEGWNPARDVDGATATLIGVGQTLVSGAIWFGIVWVPFLVALTIALAILRALWRRFAPAPRPQGPVSGWNAG